MSGENPFGKCVQERANPTVPQSSSEMWERVVRAEATALDQRELTQRALAEMREEEKTVEEESTVEALVVAKEETGDTHTGTRVWFVIMFLIWLVPSLGAFASSFLGGVIMSSIWALVCLIVARIPSMASGAFAGGGRNNRGAAV